MHNRSVTGLRDFVIVLFYRMWRCDRAKFYRLETVLSQQQACTSCLTLRRSVRLFNIRSGQRVR